MIHHHILDWDDAYANTPNIPGGERYPDLWVEPAQSFRTGMLAEGRARVDVAYGLFSSHASRRAVKLAVLVLAPAVTLSLPKIHDGQNSC